MAIFKEQLFVIILTFFAIWTGFIGIVNLSAAGEITLSDWSALSGGTIPGQVTPQFSNTISGTSALLTSQDYTTATGFTNNISITAFNVIGDGTWNQIDDVGYVLASTGLLTGHASITVKGIQPTNNVYMATYYLNNPSGADFTIYPRSIESGGTCNTNTNLQLDIKADGLHYKNKCSVAGVDPGDAFYLPDPELAPSSGSAYKVVLDETNHLLTLYKDGNMISSISGIRPADTADNAFGVYYATVESKTVGFTVQKIEASINQDAPYNTATGIPFIDAIIGAASALAQIANALAQFGALIGAMIGLTSTPAIPFWAWAWIGLPLIGALFYMGIQLITRSG